MVSDTLYHWSWTSVMHEGFGICIDLVKLGFSLKGWSRKDLNPSHPHAVLGTTEEKLERCI